jgi:hypothetical protein
MVGDWAHVHVTFFTKNNLGANLQKFERCVMDPVFYQQYVLTVQNSQTQTEIQHMEIYCLSLKKKKSCLFCCAMLCTYNPQIAVTKIK